MDIGMGKAHVRKIGREIAAPPVCAPSPAPAPASLNGERLLRDVTAALGPENRKRFMSFVETLKMKRDNGEIPSLTDALVQHGPEIVEKDVWNSAVAKQQVCPPTGTRTPSSQKRRHTSTPGSAKKRVRFAAVPQVVHVQRYLEVEEAELRIEHVGLSPPYMRTWAPPRHLAAEAQPVDVR